MTTTTGFGPGELRYLKRLETALLIAPRRDRARVLAVARQHMAERPPAASYDLLVEELGPPEAYTRQLMADENVGAEAPRWRRCAARARSREAIVITVVAIALAGVAAWFAAGWILDEPTITNNCGGVPGTDPSVPVEQIEAAERTEYRLGYVEGAEVGIFFCLTANETVEVLDISVPDASRALFRPQEVRLQFGFDDPVPFEPFTLVSRSDPEYQGGVHVHVIGTFENCEHWAEGSSYGFDEATMTYRFRWRTRTVPIDLLAEYAFVSGSDEGCPARSGDVRTP